jgi:hypothetical protein
VPRSRGEDDGSSLQLIRERHGRCFDCTCHLKRPKPLGRKVQPFHEQAEPGMAALIANFGGSQWVQAACCELENIVVISRKHSKTGSHNTVTTYKDGCRQPSSRASTTMTLLISAASISGLLALTLAETDGTSTRALPGRQFIELRGASLPNTSTLNFHQ